VRFIEELKRRNVFRVGVAYVIAAWVLLQFADLVLANIHAPDWVIQAFMLALAIGLPLSLFFAWAYELTPEGVKREKDVDRGQSITSQTGRKLDRAIIVIMAIALAWFAWDRFGAPPEAMAPAAGTTPDAEQAAEKPRANVKSLAVLPFVAMSSGADDEYFADGLTEEILNSLSQLPELLVTARTSSFHFKGQDIPVQEIAATLGVQHIVEGSVRRSGDRLRVTAQLIRAADGFHIWSESYDSTSSDTIQVQEDIAVKIAGAMNVVMDDGKREAMRRAGMRNVEAFVDYQKAQELYDKAHSGSNPVKYLREANRELDKVIGLVPNFAPAYIKHSDLHVHMLLADSAGLRDEDVTDREIEEAPAIIMSDLTKAAENARNFSERNDIEIDMAFIGGDWHNLPANVDLFLDGDSCDHAAWVLGIIAIYGLAERYTERARLIRKCNPMRPWSWIHESYANLWAGDKEEALRVAREGMETAPGSWLNFALVNALVANGLFEEADHVSKTQFRVVEEAILSKVLNASAKGNLDAASALYQQLTQQADFNPFYESLYYAWVGDRQKANRLAARIDTHPFGSQQLLDLVSRCTCGAPFDLEATPNFAARIETANMPWPPASPIRFPLKDW
jgi:TolB-like protein